MNNANTYPELQGRVQLSLAFSEMLIYRAL